VRFGARSVHRRTAVISTYFSSELVHSPIKKTPGPNAPPRKTLTMSNSTKMSGCCSALCTEFLASTSKVISSVLSGPKLI